MNKVTVCILVYNAEKYLQETFDSLECQEANFKYLIIDDGSSDRSNSICNNFKCKTQRECTVKHFDQNHGTAFCRNWALNNADTDYMMFFDSDDIAESGLISTLYQHLNANKDCIAVSCHARYIDSNGQRLPGGMFFEMQDADAFKQRAENGKFVFMLPVTLFRRDYAVKAGGYRQNGFPEGKIRYQDLSEDLDLWSRMSDFYVDGKYMIIFPKILYCYRKRTDSLSSTKDRQFAMSLKMKYIKYNIKCRRAGKPEIAFTDFLSNRSKWERIQDKRRFYSEYYYRKAAFAFAEHRYANVILNLPVSIILNPGYFLQKMYANIGNK